RAGAQEEYLVSSAVDVVRVGVPVEQETEGLVLADIERPREDPLRVHRGPLREPAPGQMQGLLRDVLRARLLLEIRETSVKIIEGAVGGAGVGGGWGCGGGWGIC